MRLSADIVVLLGMGVYIGTAVGTAAAAVSEGGKGGEGRGGEGGQFKPKTN